MSALAMIGSLILFFMVPRGRYEPDRVIGHMKVDSDNQKQVVTKIHDETKYGSYIKTKSGAHAARELTPPVKSPVVRQQCFDALPPWPNFNDDWSSGYDAMDTEWSNENKLGDDNFWSTARALQHILKCHSTTRYFSVQPISGHGS